MKNDIVERVRKGGLPDPKIQWPTMHFESGGPASGSDAAAATGVSGIGASDAAAATGNSSAPGDVGGDVSGPSGDSEGQSCAAQAMGIPGLGFADAAAALGNSTAVGSGAVFGDPSSGFAVVGVPGLGEIGLPSGGMTATNGMSQDTLSALSSMGLGNMSISDTQTVDQAMAAMSVHGAMNNNLASMLSMVSPAFGQAVAVAQGIQGLMSGQANIGQTAVNAAIGMVAASLGVPAGVVAGVVNGNPGQAVSSATVSAVSQGLAQALGLPSSVVGAVMGQSGATSALGQAVSGSVNSALGTSPTGQSNTAAVAAGINGAIGGLGLGSIGSSSSTSDGAVAGTSGGPSDFGGGGLDASQLFAAANQFAAPAATRSATSGLNSLTGSSPSSIDYSKLFLECKPDFLTSKIVDKGSTKGGLKQQELRQILEDRQMAQAPSEEQYFASGGSTTCFACELSKSFLPETTDVLQSSTSKRRAPLELIKLKHIQPRISSMGNMEGMARGGLPKKYQDAAPEGHETEFVTGLTGFYACGRGTGQSDCIPAMLHDGDYVMDAEAVSALGDGSSKAGKEVLEKFHKQIPHQASTGGKVVPAKIADGEYVFPAGFVTALGGGDNKKGAEILDGLREKLRSHKRSAPTSKIPPKAKSPLDYLKMAKG